MMIWGPFLESPGTFSGPESYFVFVMFAFKIKVLIILKIIQWNYQFRSKIDWFVGQELCSYSTGFEF